MNKNLRNYIKAISKSIGRFINNSNLSVTSILRMLVLSKIDVVFKSNNYPKLKSGKNCTVLANGPSLKKALENKEVILDGNDVFVVNMFVQSQEFWTIKPHFYFLTDGAFFAPQNERHLNFVSILNEGFKKVDWDMYLCIPSGCINGGVLKSLDNHHVKVLKWNTATFEGFRCLCHFVFKHNMAMPRCQTVANMALMSAINMKYENVYLYGADHGWTKDLRVDDDNVVCYGDRHVYATKLNVIKLQYNIADLLRQYANMFETHMIIEHYARSRKCKIWNCTVGSYVDAYERKYNQKDV